MNAWGTGSKQEGGQNVVDDSRNTDSFVATGAGEQLHHGWVHPYFDRDSDCCCVDKDHSRQKSNIAGRERHGQADVTSAYYGLFSDRVAEREDLRLKRTELGVAGDDGREGKFFPVARGACP